MVSIPRNGSSRSIDLNSEGCKIVAEPYMKHPLQDRWCLWFLEYDRSKSWEEMQNKVSTFDTVEDFWCLYDHIKNASELDDQNDYSVFKGNIRPMWEDPANNRGGRWILSAYKQRHEIDNYWLNTLLYLIGGNSKYASHINGAVVNVRQHGRDRISIWTDECHNYDVINGIGREFKDYLRTNMKIVYEGHNNNSNNRKGGPMLQL